MIAKAISGHVTGNTTSGHMTANLTNVMLSHED